MEAPVHPSNLIVLKDTPQWAVCNKPGGLLSVPGRGKDKADSMLNRVRWHHPFGTRAEAAHRLDMETSGAFLVAFNQRANSHLQQQFAKRKTGKVYLAFVPTQMAATGGEIDLPLKQIARSIRGHRVAPDGKKAITRFLVLERTNQGTLLALYPLTGRTHQLRVHCKESSEIGSAILGDPLYGPEPKTDTLHLHAWYLSFRCPITERLEETYAPLPETWGNHAGQLSLEESDTRRESQRFGYTLDGREITPAHSRVSI